MNKAAKDVGGLDGLSTGAAQQGRPAKATAAAATQATSDNDTLLRGLLSLDQVELKLVTSFLIGLGAAHSASRVREQRDTLYQQLAMRLYQERRCAESSALLDLLREALPADDSSGASSGAHLQTVFGYMKGVSDLVRSRVVAERRGSLLPATPAAASLQLSQVMAAKRAARGWLRNELGEAMLRGFAAQDEEVSRRAEAIIECLDAQARPAS